MILGSAALKARSTISGFVGSSMKTNYTQKITVLIESVKKGGVHIKH